MTDIEDLQQAQETESGAGVSSGAGTGGTAVVGAATAGTAAAAIGTGGAASDAGGKGVRAAPNPSSPILLTSATGFLVCWLQVLGATVESHASVGGTLGVGGHTTFTLSVWVGEKTWRVQQRYSAFHALKTSLDDEIKGLYREVFGLFLFTPVHQESISRARPSEN
jgi:hypothetical protein